MLTAAFFLIEQLWSSQTGRGSDIGWHWSFVVNGGARRGAKWVSACGFPLEKTAFFGIKNRVFECASLAFTAH